ncbi:hypothetical protein OPQ81_009072 [Rhizoctonia solani]|nr:hypothetical protein OPQ81_009072 [Rhizoctonia solani]
MLSDSIRTMRRQPVVATYSTSFKHSSNHRVQPHTCHYPYFEAHRLPQKNLGHILICLLNTLNVCSTQIVDNIASYDSDDPNL